MHTTATALSSTYICVALWAATTLRYALTRHRSVALATASLALRPFVSALGHFATPAPLAWVDCVALCVLLWAAWEAYTPAASAQLKMLFLFAQVLVFMVLPTSGMAAEALALCAQVLLIFVYCAFEQHKSTLAQAALQSSPTPPLPAATLSHQLRLALRFYAIASCVLAFYRCLTQVHHILSPEWMESASLLPVIGAIAAEAYSFEPNLRQAWHKLEVSKQEQQVHFEALQKTTASLHKHKLEVAKQEQQVRFEALQKTTASLHEQLNAKEEVIQARRKFFVSAMRELQSRARAITGVASRINECQLDVVSVRYARSLCAETCELDKLIMDITEFADLDDGQADLKLCPFDLEEDVMEPVLARIHRASSPLGSKDVDVSYHVADDVPRFLIGDKYQLFQVLQQLVHNAIKYTEQGGVVIEVLRRAESAQADNAKAEETVRLTFVVHDTGLSISGEHMDTLFTPFASPTANTDGGLGLSIAQRRTLLFSGQSIRVSRLAGQGSKFTFSAKFQIDHQHPPSAPSESLSLAGQHIYIVEKNEDVCKQLVNHLTPLDCLVHYTTNCTQGQDEVEKGLHRGILLLGYDLGGVTGLNFLNMIPQHIRKSLKVVMLCTLAQAKTISSHAPDAIIRKPILKRELLATVLRYPLQPPLAEGEWDVVDARRRNEEQEEEEQEEEEQQEAPEPTKRLSVGQPFHVLIVENNSINVRILQAQIERTLGHRCTVARDGQQALDIHETTFPQFDIILMSWRLPHLNELEATHVIQQRESREWRRESVPIIGMGGTEARELCLAAGMVDFIQKPVSHNQLVAALQHAKWKPLVLLAEEGPANARAAAHVLRSSGFKVDVADDGATALSRFQANHNRYDAIVTGCCKDSLAFVRDILMFEAEQGLPRIPIIALSSNYKQEQEALGSGCNAFVLRSQLPVLGATVKKFLF